MRRFFYQFAIGTIVMLVVLAGMVALPHDPYIRWQAVKTEAFARLGWIYERIHFDQTPIDIAFIGTSHTMNGIDAQAFEDDINAANLRTEDGNCLHAVNLSIPSYGRDLHWVIGRELLENRKVKVLVVEVFENETRKAHPLFVSVADTKDVLEAPLLINMNYFHNLIRLPYRQLSLWVKTLSPKDFDLKDHFDPNDYDGSNVDNTRIVNVGGKELSPLRSEIMPRDKLEAAGQFQLNKKNLHMLGTWGEEYEYAVPNYYLTSLLDLAKSKGVEVVFFYLPQYGMPQKPVDDRLYKGRGAWIFVNDLLQKPEYWFEEAHLNAAGAAAVTQRTAAEFVRRWYDSAAAEKADGVVRSSSTVACKHGGYEARPHLTPFHASHTDQTAHENDQ